MADPFSVAASAVSVVSLGIQVCQGLLTYYGDYKSYDDTVGLLCRKIEGLRSTLQICDEALQKPGLTTSKASANVTNNIGACKDGLDLLQKTLDSCKKTPKPQGFQAKIHNYAQQSSYPLKKSNILRLQSIVKELQDNVQTALLVSQTEGLIDQSSNLAAISASSASGVKQGKHIQDGIERIDRTLQKTQSVLPIFQRQGELSSLNLHALRDDVQSIHDDMKDHHASFSGSFATLKTQFEKTTSSTESAILARMDDFARQNLTLMCAVEQLSEASQIRGATLESDVKSLQLSLLQKPSLLKDTCDEFKSLETHDMATSIANRKVTWPSRVRPTRTGTVCSCRFRTNSQKYSRSQYSNSRETSWTFSLNSANIYHRHDCPHSSWAKSSWSLNFRLAYCSRLLARAVQTSISFTKGSGGMSLSPTMNLRCLVAHDSPGFALIREPFPQRMSVYDMETVVSQRVQKLRQMFQDRKASPYDVDINGNTLIHVVFKVNHSSSDYMHLSRDDMENLRTCLIAQMHTLGVPLNEVNEEGETSLNCLVDSHLRCIYNILPLHHSMTQLIDLGAELQNIIPHPGTVKSRWFHPKIVDFGLLMTKITDIAEATKCNDISLAVTRKSEVDLRRALTVSRHTINEANSMGQTALHLAVDWLPGMRLLLEAGADVDCRDCVSQSPLDYAIEQSLIEPIHALAHADCSLIGIFDDVSPIVLRGPLVLYHAIQIECWEPGNAAAERVVDVLTDLVIQRRRRLCDLAIHELPASELAYFYPHGDHNSYLVDENASRLSSALKHHGIPVSSALDPGSDRITVYHQILGSSRVAERLWRAGFRDIDGRDSSGRTPLMHTSLFNDGGVSRYLECVAWFLSKGADFNAKQDLTLYYEYTGRQGPFESRLPLSATSLQFVAYNVGCEFGLYIYQPKALYLSLSEISKRVLEQILTDNVPDGCVCACSIQGCKAITSMIKAFLYHNGLNERFLYVVNLWTSMKDICDSLKISEFLRLITCEALGLKHTCCRVVWARAKFVFSKIGDQSEIDEIHDVEAADLQILEELLEEFEAKRIELDLPFSDFLKEYWRPRMDEILNEGDLNKEAMREIGVRIYESE